MDQELGNSVDRLLQVLTEMIYQVISVEIPKVFSDFIFLTLFNAIKPSTPSGKKYSRMIVNMWKRLSIPGE